MNLLLLLRLIVVARLFDATAGFLRLNNARLRRSVCHILSDWHNSHFVDHLAVGNEEGPDVPVSAATPSPQSNVLDNRIREPRLLAVDVISVAIAAHLMAFADVMSDPLQFEPPAPSPLPMLIQRDSLLTVCWVLSAIQANGYKQETVASNQSVVTSTIRISAGLAILRVAMSLASEYLGLYGTDVHGWEIVRQIYTT